MGLGHYVEDKQNGIEGSIIRIEKDREEEILAEYRLNCKSKRG